MLHLHDLDLRRRPSRLNPQILRREIDAASTERKGRGKGKQQGRVGHRCFYYALHGPARSCPDEKREPSGDMMLLTIAGHCACVKVVEPVRSTAALTDGLLRYCYPIAPALPL